MSSDGRVWGGVGCFQLFVMGDLGLWIFLCKFDAVYNCLLCFLCFSCEPKARVRILTVQVFNTIYAVGTIFVFSVNRIENYENVRKNY